MNRRRTFAALAIAALVTIGPGPRAESYDLRQTCKTDLPAIFELCDPQGSYSGCKDVRNEEMAAGCQAACVMMACPEQITFWPSKTDPIWRPSCADMHGAPFWRNLHRAGLRCNAKLHVYSTEVDRATRLACLQRQAEEDCPALAGTDWWDHRP
jgi:hypothetical protein